MTTLVHFMRTRVTLGACLVALVCALTAPAAYGDAYDRVFADYQKDGRIDPCRHSEGELRTAKGQIPSDIEQYAPDFPAALDDALEQRARGGCGGEASAAATETETGTPGAPAAGGGSATGGAAPAQSTTPAPNTPGVAPAPPGTANPAEAADDGAIARAASQSADRGGDAPAPLLVLGVAGGLLALALAVWGLARWLAFEPAFWVRWRHALSEAGWHVGGAWENFSDWLRRGRAAG
jgi:hypothetical protein